MPVSYQTIQVNPVTPTIGAEVFGVDLSQPINAVTLADIHRAWMEHLVLFFRDQELSIEQHKAFARRFGDLHVHPTAPGLNGDTEVFVVHVDCDSKHQPGDSWHTDVSCDQQPPLGSVLRLFEVPESGGDTLFVNMYAVYESLSPAMQGLLSELRAVHSAGHAYVGRYDDEPRRDGSYPQASHPVVRTHPVTRRKGIYVNEGFTTHIEGLCEAESAAVLGFLYAHIRKPEFQCRFVWQNHSMAMWDNRCTQHYALWDYYPATRSGYRMTIAGDRPR